VLERRLELEGMNETEELSSEEREIVVNPLVTAEELQKRALRDLAEEVRRWGSREQAFELSLVSLR